MATLAELLVKVGIDGSGIDRQAQGVSQRLSGIGRTMSATVTPALIGLGVVATNAASDLEESINAIDVVFGSAGDRIHEFGKTAEDTVGLSTRAFNELVTPVGAALQNVGFSADEAAESSIGLAERAADMASVFNTDVSEALAAIQAGLRGEADPLERFGVGLSDAAVTAKAMELGLADTRAELDANDKAQARLALIMEQTDKIAGDFANTSSSVANQERIAAAEAENMAAAFGQQLLPVKTQLIGVLRSVLGAFNGLSPGMQRIIVIAAGVVAAIGPLLLLAGSLTRNVMTLVPAFKAVGVAFTFLSKLLLANPWILVAAAIIALVVVVVKNWDTIKKAISTAWNFVKNVTSTVWNAIRGFLAGVWNAIRGAVSSAINTVRSVISGAWNAVRSATSSAWNAIRSAVVSAASGLLSFVQSIPGKIIGFFASLPGRLFNIGKNIIQSLIDGVKNMIGAVGDAVGSVVSKVTDLWPFSPAKEGPLRRHPPELAGENIGRLFAEGLRQAERDVVAAAEAITRNAVMAPMTPDIPAMRRFGGDGRGGAGLHVEHLEVKAFSDRFSIRQVMDDLAMHGVS